MKQILSYFAYPLFNSYLSKTIRLCGSVYRDKNQISLSYRSSNVSCEKQVLPSSVFYNILQSRLTINKLHTPSALPSTQKSTYT